MQNYMYGMSTLEACTRAEQRHNAPLLPDTHTHFAYLCTVPRAKQTNTHILLTSRQAEEGLYPQCSSSCRPPKAHLPAPQY